MASNFVISVLGHKGSGKSTLVKEIVEEHPRVITFDTMGEYDNAIETFPEAVRELGKLEHARRFKIAIRLPEDEDALEAMEVAYELTGTLVVFEETSFYCSPSYLPTILKKFVRYGRHREISQIYVSRRPAEIHRDLTAQSDLIVSFRQHEPADVDYLRKLMGPEADKLPTLPKYRIIASGDVKSAPLPVLQRLAQNGELTAEPEEE
jgi:DNA helicase HerA-like ATPase